MKKSYHFLVCSDVDPNIFIFCDKVTKLPSCCVTERHLHNGIVESFIIPKSIKIKVLTTNYLSDGNCPAFYPDGDPDSISRDGLILGYCNCCEHFNDCIYNTSN